VQPFFAQRELALSYARSRRGGRLGEIRVLNSAGEVEETIPFDERFRRD
jgi:hypothetical protein